MGWVLRGGGEDGAFLMILRTLGLPCLPAPLVGPSPTGFGSFMDDRSHMTSSRLHSCLSPGLDIELLGGEPLRSSLASLLLLPLPSCVPSGQPHTSLSLPPSLSCSAIHLSLGCGEDEIVNM